MKTKTLFITLSLLVLAGCTMTETAESPDYNQETITIAAYNAEGRDTKTQRDETDGSVLWTPGDAISLFYGSGVNGGSKFVSIGEDVSRLTNFRGTIGVITGGADISVEDTYFWGLYPYDDEAVCDGSTIVTTLSNRQEAVPSTFADKLFPSIGRSQGLSMAFYNICGGVRFTVIKEGLKSVTLKAIGGEYLTGKAKVGFEAGVPKVMEIMEGSDSITLTAPAGKYFEVGKFYYFITFPQALSEGIEMTFESFTEKGSYVRHTSDLAIKRSVFGTLRNVDQDVTYTQKNGAIPIEDPVLKNYLLPDYDIDGDGEISFSEAREVTEVRISPSNQYNLQSLYGIEYMPNLEAICCNGEWYDIPDKTVAPDRDYYYLGPYNGWDCWGPIGTLKYVDVSNNPKLKSLEIQNNSGIGYEMGSLDLSKNLMLNNLWIGMTWLPYPDISKNTNLEIVDMSHLRGAFPNMAALTKVRTLLVEWPQDENVERVCLNVSNMPELEVLSASGRICSLSDLSLNPMLKTLWVDNNNLEDLVLSSNNALEDLQCQSNHLQTLDLSNNINLKKINCNSNIITGLYLPNINSIEYLNVNQNRLSELNVSHLISVNQLYCDDNPIASLDLSNNALLSILGFSGTQISTIDISHNCELTTIGCDSIPSLTNLNVSNNAKLEKLFVRNCGLATLDVSHNPLLRELLCDWNSICSINVSNNLYLEKLSCIQRDDLEGNNYLKTLFIAQGQTIPNVTIDRSADYIPVSTVITIAPSSGGGEGTGDDDW